MPRRKTIFATGELYHIYNRSIAEKPIFKGNREIDIFMGAMRFYLQPTPPTKFSIYRKSPRSFPIKLDHRIVTIINYCFMPNHFHLTLRQEKDGGIKQFIQRVLNSFAHYFSSKYKTKGHIFEDKYKAVRIVTDEQLFHLSRYIHLNPVTGYLTEKPEAYKHSSFNIYLGKESSDIIDPTLIMGNFSSPQSYYNFVMSQKEYQRSLDAIYHLILE